MLSSLGTFLSSIKCKILIAFLLIVGVSFSYMVNSLSRLVANQLYNQRMRQDSVSVEKLSTAVAPFFQSARDEQLNQLLSSYGGEMGGRLIIVDNSAKVQCDTYSELNGTKLETGEIMAVLTGGKLTAYGIHRTGEGENSTLTSYCSAAITGTQGTVGVLLFVSPVQELEENLQAVIRQMMLVFIGVACIVLLMAFVFSHVLTKPVAELTRTIQKMGKGDLSARVRVHGSGELAELAKSYNKMAQQLENLDNDKSQFISNASHELKTPLAGIKIMVENMLYQPDMPEELRSEFMGDIDREIDRLTAVVTDLLALSKMDAGKAAMTMEKLNLVEMAEETARLLSANATLRDQRIFLHMPEEVIVTGDKSKLNQVFYNLIENAEKYTQNGGKIDIELKQEGENALFSVTDNGVGISKENQEHIFERFYRVDKARSRETGGTGLGLAIVRQLVELHGGTVSVKSKPGKGSTFTVSLPVERREKQREGR